MLLWPQRRRWRRRFDLYAYVQAQYGAAECFKDRLPTMYAFVEAHLRDQKELGRLEHPERTLKSYVLQEAEAISRCEKLRWAESVGRRVVNLQHDGVILRLWRHDDRGHVEEQLSRLCSAALGYEQPVRRD